MQDESNTMMYPQGSPQSIGLFKRGVKKAAPRLLTAENEMNSAATPGGRLNDMAMESMAVMPMDNMLPMNSPEFLRRKKRNNDALRYEEER